MRKIVICIICFLLYTSNVFALRCGNFIISGGDLKHEVRLNCGEPISTEVVGYVDIVESETIDGEKSEKRIRVMKNEEWIIEINSYNTTYYYSLVFEGGGLVEIRAAGQK